MGHAIHTQGIYHELQKAVSRYFLDRQISRFANRNYVGQLTLIALLIISSYIWLLSGYADTTLAIFAAYFLFNAGSVLWVVNLSHDACHQCISPSRTLNHLLGFSWNIMGISRYLWEAQHHRSHHHYTGIPGRDVDVDETLWIRYSPLHRNRPWFRYQHLYAPFLYLLFGIFVVYVKDFLMYYSGKLRPCKPRYPSFFPARLLLTKLLYTGITVLIPAALLPQPAWLLVLAHLAGLSVCSGLMLLVLVIPHINADAAQYSLNPVPRTRDGWAMHQVQSSIDCSSRSRWLNGLLGGLNTHLVHHLFPRICHIHYPGLTREISKVLQARGIPYRERSFGQAIKEHFLFLRQIGKSPA